MNPTRKLILLFALAPLTGCSTGSTLAVFDIEDASGKLDPASLTQLGDHLVARLGETGKIKLVPRSELRGACPGGETACRREHTGKLDASGMLIARILRPGERCSLTLSMLSRDGKRVVRSSAVPAACDADAMVLAIDRAVRRLGPPWAQRQGSNMDKEIQMLEEQLRLRFEAERRKLQEEIEHQAKEIERLRTAPQRHVVEEPRPFELPPADGTVDPFAAKGKLSINSLPWAKVFIDGRLVGNTPIVDLKLPAGTVLVELVGPMGQRKRQQVTIKAGKSRKLTVRLPRPKSP